MDNDNLFFQDNTLKNKLQKLSDEAKNKMLNNLKLSNQNEDGKEGDYNNFTQEFFLERYKKFIPSKVVTPSSFNIKSELGNKFKEEIPSNPDYLLSLIHKKMNNSAKQEIIDGLTLFSWTKCYNELNEDKIDLKEHMRKNHRSDYSVIETLQNFFCKYSFNSKKEIIIAEVSEIKHIDCIQIIEVQVYKLYNFRTLAD